MIVTLIILAVLLLLVLLGNKSVHSEITIKASPEKVWEVLTQTDQYASWNPVMKLIEGEIKEGNKVTYQFTQSEDNSYNIGTTVKKIIPLKLLNQGGGLPLILSFNHRYMLEASGEGTTLTIHEDYKGIGVNFWNAEPVQAAYEKLNAAIKQEAESR
ncbi:MAG: SRPBCC domain-containing protein [Bacteroidota bacterium]